MSPPGTSPEREPGSASEKVKKDPWALRVLRRLLRPVLRPLHERLHRLDLEQARLGTVLEQVQDQLLDWDRRIVQAEHGLDALQRGHDGLQGEVERLRDRRLPQAEQGLGELQRGLETLQRGLQEVRDVRIAQAENGLHSLHDSIASLQEAFEQRLRRNEQDLRAGAQTVQQVQEGVEEVRDQRLPALARAWEATAWRLHEQMEAVGGMVDRILADEPLGIASAGVEPLPELPEAVRQATVAMTESLRGPVSEIAFRAAEIVELVRECEPVADLGCGRGELLEALQSQSIRAMGVDADPAMVASCRRIGLEVHEEQARPWLESRPDGSLGAVVAVHLLEHLNAGEWATLLAEAARCLRPGGVLVVECPNPDSLRVGAGLFWSDPTHVRPIHPVSLTLVLQALGLQVAPPRYRRPFPQDQLLAASVEDPQLRDLAVRLDEMLSGPRDFVVVATKSLPAD